MMMTSSNENISRVTGPLCGEFPRGQRQVTWSFDVFFDMRCVNNLEAGDLRRYRAHYDIMTSL